jgi:hypothetical protein
MVLTILGLFKGAFVGYVAATIGLAAWVTGSS